MQEEVDQIFSVENDMERQWNVLKFTCGLMDDSSLLIERICEAFVEIVTRPNPRGSFGSLYGSRYLTDINREKTPKSLNPFYNAQVCYSIPGCISTYPEEQVDCHLLFLLNGWDMHQLRPVSQKIIERYLVPRLADGFNVGQNLPPCSVVIYQGLQAPLGYFLAVCSCIRQPIKHLLILGQEIPCTPSGAAVQLPKIGQRPENITAPQYEPSSAMRNRSEPERVSHVKGLNFSMRNRSEPAGTSDARGLNFSMRNRSEPVGTSNARGPDDSFIAINFEYLTTAVFHEVNCHDHIRSLNQCKLLTHLTYIQCIGPSFHTLGKNKNLKELIVENCFLEFNTEQELYAQIGDLKQLERISFKKMKYEKYLSKFNRVNVFSSLTSLKKLSLQDCELTTPTALALMKSLVQCPLVDLDLSDNFLFGFINKLHQTPGIAFVYLERMNCNNNDLLKTDTTALARLISENRLPVIKTVLMKGNDLANDRASLGELGKSCEHFQRRKGYRVQVYMDRKKEIRKSDGNSEVERVEKRDEMKVSVKNDEVKHRNRLDEVQSRKAEDESKAGNRCQIL